MRPLLSRDLASSDEGPVLIARVLEQADLRATEPHRHARGQLLGSTRGLVSVQADLKRWVVPATHAVWIPPDLLHSLRSHGPFAGWSLYLAPLACGGMPEEPCVLAMSGLLREAVGRAATWDARRLEPAQRRLAWVMLDEMRSLPEVPLGLPIPRDARLRTLAAALCDAPGDDTGMTAWARRVGIAPRTLTRRFVEETGFTFTAWRQRARLLRAVELLAAGTPVTTVALELGYVNVSAFIALFRRTFGTTPGRWEGWRADPTPHESDLRALPARRGDGVFDVPDISSGNCTDSGASAPRGP